MDVCGVIGMVGLLHQLRSDMKSPSVIRVSRCNKTMEYQDKEAVGRLNSAGVVGMIG